MAFIYETYAEQKISAEANAMTEYIMKIRGIVPNYGNAFNLGSTGTILKIDQGMLVYTGRKAINNALEEIEVLPETLGTRTKYINVTLDGSQQPTPNSATFNISNTSAGSITSKTEDLMANLVGSVSFELGTFTNTTSGIDNSSLQLTCPIILQRSLDELNDKFGSYLPLAGGTMSGSINMNANFIYLRTGVSIQSPSAGRINLTGNIYADSLNTQGGNIQTAGGAIGTNGGQLSTGGGLITTVGGQMFTNTLYLAQTTGSTPAKVFEYRGTDSFFIQQRAFTKDINTQGFDIATDGGAVDTNGGEIRVDGGFVYLRTGVSIQSPSAGRINLVGNLYTDAINTQGKSVNTAGGPISTVGGNINTGGGYVSTLGGQVYANSILLTNTSGGNGFKAISYIDSTSFEVLKKMFTKAIDTQGENIVTNGGGINLANGDIRLSGRIYSTNNNYEQIVLEGATGTGGTKTIKLAHDTGEIAGLLSWDRSIAGFNTCYFNMLSKTSGTPYVGIRLSENERPFSYGNGKYLVEAATLFATQVSNLEINLSLQDQIDIMNNSMQTMRSELDLLKLQMSAIINGEEIPTELPPIAMLRTASTEVSFADNLRSKLEEAEAELNEQNYQDEITVVDDQIKFLEKDLEAVNVKQTRTFSNVDERFELLDNLRIKREEIMLEYGKEAL